MGSLNSKTFQEILIEDVPPTPPENRRHLDTDPRSPTSGIARTPIIVGSTSLPSLQNGVGLARQASINSLDLDPRSPSIGITRTPISVPMTTCQDSSFSALPGRLDYSLVIDPRSPTTGISRTPIHKEPDTLTDPRSPNKEIARTPIYDHKVHKSTHTPRLKPSALCQSLSDSGTPSSLNSSLGDLEPVLDDSIDDNHLSLTDRSLSEPDLLLATDTMMLIKAQPPRKSHSAKKATPSSSAKKTGKPKKLFFIGRDSSTPEKGVRRSLSTDSPNKSPVGVFKIKADGSVRSPLSTRNIDTDSPRVIMQRKQANKLGLLRRCSSTPAQHCVIFQDKENMQ